MRQRERMRNRKPKNVLVGIGSGAQSVAVGFYEGITGVFTQPFKGAQQDGLKGFCKGMFKGLVGLVFKPVTGIFDFASQTTEGVKNTVTIFDDKANEKKHRLPRVFYGREKYFRSYYEHDSQIMSDLTKFESGKYSRDNFIQSFLFTEDQSKKNSFIALLVTYEHILCFNFKNKSLLFVIEPINILQIRRLEDQNSGLVFTVRNGIEVKFELTLRKKIAMSKPTKKNYCKKSRKPLMRLDILILLAKLWEFNLSFYSNLLI